MKSSNLRFGDPTYPFTQIHVDAMDDLEGLFGPDEEKIFRDIAKFDDDDVDVNVFDRCYDSDDSCSECPYNRFRDKRNHECMWGGQCCNKEFQRTQLPKPRPRAAPIVTPRIVNKVIPIAERVTAAKCSVKTSDVMVVTNSVKTVSPAIRAEGRSLLLNRTNVPQPQPPPTPQSSRPETPVSLASEDDLGPIPIDAHNTSIFRSALDHLTTTPTFSGSWEDGLITHGSGDLNRTKHEKPATHSPTDILRLSASANSDHNYVTSKSFKLQGLGVDTPSDSEEEIDVVSVSERSRSSSCSSALPTRPTATDREHLESLLSASQAVSRKLKRTLLPCPAPSQKRKRYETESSDDGDDDDDEDSKEEEDDDDDDDDDDDEEDYDEEEVYSAMVYKRQHKRTRASPGRRKNSTFRFGEEDSQEKRDLHNNMERMRRIDLRNSFEQLKDMVPSVASKDRAAKVVILREAATYCGELGAECQSKSMQVMALRKEQERLRANVSSLRRAAAMHR